MKGSTDCDLLLYPDKSARSDKNFQNIEEKLEKELNSICSWLEDNRLEIHLDKTESILFGSKKKLKQNSKLKISSSGIQINEKNSVRYLCSDIDQALTGESMVESIIKKKANRINYLCKQSKFLTCNTSKLLALALTQ